ncbi:3'-5' exoribonuclease [Aliivibrio sifiae]
MKDLMLDIETMGNGPKAAIMSIGACYFDIKTGEIGETFHKQINLESAVQAGLVIDVFTVLWWLKQSEDARSKFYDNDDAFHINHVLSEFTLFVKDHSKVWGNGATFDNVILKNAYKKCFQTDAPWAFYNDMDVRTIVRLGRDVGFDPKKDMPFDGVRHDALADAIHQARYVSAIYQKLI